MIDINRNNYEEYFLDFIEGNLSPSDKNLFMSFLDENPDLKKELELYEEKPISYEKYLFENKSTLKKGSVLSEITSNNFDELCIAKIENDLTQKEENDFDIYINQDTQKRKEFDLYKLTKIEIDDSILFKDKELLKKKTAGFAFRKHYTLISAAASVIILIALYLFIPKSEQDKVELPIAELSEGKNLEITNKVTEEEQSANILNTQEDKKIATLTEKQIVLSQKLSLEIINTEETVKTNYREYDQIAQLEPMQVNYDFTESKNEIDIIYVNTYAKNYVAKEPEYVSFKSYLASAFNKRILKKENKNKLELFDVAQAGVEGINMLTGGKMTLERIYDENGNPDKTEFNSRLIAFSAPAKKRLKTSVTN